MLKHLLSLLEDFNSLQDGTYDLITKKPINFRTGYQVTFHCSDMEYTEEEYADLTKKFCDLTGSPIFIGVYGKPEVSFYTKDMILALRLAKEYNQKSIWDWERSSEIKNKYYDSSKGNK
ncbi:MAG: hypothetical protein IJQ23_01245 [Clostridia bacterium]|nr:hypothetical protein [Clostridia bacterium]